MANGQIKINELPETAVVKGDDVFIVENGIITQKISLANLDKYINEHLPFGTTKNTVYDGALGKAVSDGLALHTTSTANPHSVTKSQVGLSNVDNTSDMSKPVSTLQQTFIDSAYANSNAYTDQKIADLINGAPSTLDTLGKIANALQNNPGVSDALEEAIGSKADAAELDSHVRNDTIHITASERLSLENKLDKDMIVDNLPNALAVTEDNVPVGCKAVSELCGKLGNCWISFTDADGNPTDIPYIHWYADDGTEVTG